MKRDFWCRLRVLGRTITLGSPNFLSSRAQFMSYPNIAHMLLRNLSLTDPIMTRAPVRGPCCRRSWWPSGQKGDTCLVCESLHTWKKCLVCLLIARHIPKLIIFYQEAERTAIKPSSERRKSHAQFAACASPLGLQFNAIWCIPAGGAWLLLIKKKLKDLCWD